MDAGAPDAGPPEDAFVPPPCDVTLSPGWLDDPTHGGDDSGFDDVVEMEAFLLGVTEQTADATRTVCLEDGVDIITTTVETGDALTIPHNNMLIAGLPGATASIRNLRTDDLGTSWENWQAHSGVWSERLNTSLHNLSLSVASQEGRVVYINAGGSADTLSQLTIVANGYHSEGIHARGRVENVMDVSIVTDGDYGYGIEPQTNGDFGSIRRVTITTNGSSAHGIGAWVNDGAHIDELLDTVITTAGAGANALRIGDVSSIRRMERVTLRRNDPNNGAHAIVVETEGVSNYFLTANIKDNTVCTMAGSTSWVSLLSDDSTPYTGPTVPFVSLPDGPFGAQTFPWGDASHAEDNPGYNWQTQWGGPCP
jgi:hypothetical protein